MLNDRIVTLYDMLRFHADEFYRLGRALEVLSKSEMDRPGAKPWTDQQRTTILEKADRSFQHLANRCAVFNLSLSEKRLREYAPKVRGEIGSAEFHATMGQINWLIESELKKEVFYHIASANAKYIQEWEDEWKKVTTQYSDVAPEAERAAAAMSFEDYAGAVFHLMQIMELAFDAMNTKLGITLPTRRMWGDLLKEIEEHFRAIHAPTAAKGQIDAWSGKEPEWTSILADLRSVKNAWRNPVSHKDEMVADKFYEPKVAKKIYAAVLAFMENLTMFLNPSESL